ncbi:MAG: hypothetical protein ACPGLV_17295 [Bacteroidia bacterium]
MTKFLCIALFLCCIPFSLFAKYNTAQLFEVDFNQIDKELARVTITEKQIIESGNSFGVPLSNSFEIPTDSLNQDFPILGIPTFFWVMTPTLLCNCLIPCSGTVYGITSLFYIRHFGKDEEINREAFAGLIAGQVPLYFYAAILIMSFR